MLNISLNEKIKKKNGFTDVYKNKEIKIPGKIIYFLICLIGDITEIFVETIFLIFSRPETKITHGDHAYFAGSR